jgi:Mu transposase, C-terminal domain
LRETFVPLAHPSGHARVAFGEAIAVIGGVRQKIRFFCMDLPQSDAPFVKAYPAETTEVFLDGHVSAFAFFGGAPLSVLYDNTTIAVAKICGDGRRERTRAFTELQSHYLFRDRFGRPGKGNDKGKVEGLVKYARSNFMTPIPQAASRDDLNAMLEERCRRRQGERAGRHSETIGERLVADLESFRDPPAVPLEACEKRAARVSSTALVRYRCNDYLVPTAYGFRDVVVKGFVDEVVILCAGEQIARHRRAYGTGTFVFEPLRYLRADRDEAECPRPGGGAERLGSAGGVPAPAPSPGAKDGQPRQAGVHPGPAADGGDHDGDRGDRGHRSDPARRHRL